MEIEQRIQRIVELKPVTVFIKGTPDRPMCAGSDRMIELLDRCKAEYQAIDLQAEPEIRAYLPKFSDFPAFPQLFLQGEFIGGVDVVADLYEHQDLQMMIASLSSGEAA